MVAQNILDWFDINKIEEKYKQANKKALEARQEWEEKHPIISGIQKDYQPGYRAAVPRWEQAAEYGLNAPLKEQAKTGLKEFGLNLVPSVNIAVDAATGGSGTLTKQAVKQAIAKPLVPYVGKQIAKNTAEGLIKGAEAAAIGGATQGVTSSLADNGISKDLLSRPILYGGMGLLTGGAFGGLGGFGAGQIGKQLARKNLLGNPEAQMNFARDYLEGLNDKVLTKQGFTLGDIRGLKTGNYGNLNGEELLDQYMYHGTPYNKTYTNFDSNYLGTGEGAQMYGSGTYGAKSADVANKNYRFMGENQEPIKYNNRPLLDLYDDLERQASRLDPKDAQQYYDKMSLIEDLEYKGMLDNLDDYYTPDIQKWYRNEIEPNITMPGNLYKVRIPDNEYFLDFTKSFEEQSPYVRENLKKYFNLDTTSSNDLNTGEDLYNYITREFAENNQQKASELLDTAGIKGNRYIGDRDGEAFVIFNPKNAEIVDAYMGDKKTTQLIRENAYNKYSDAIIKEGNSKNLADIKVSDEEYARVGAAINSNDYPKEYQNEVNFPLTLSNGRTYLIENNGDGKFRIITKKAVNNESTFFDK